MPPDGRVSLCWASANQDASAFPAPSEIRLDRKPNPHLAFGFGTHLCLGAAHARLLLRSLLSACLQQVGRLSIINARRRIENEARYQREVGFESLTLAFSPPP